MPDPTSSATNNGAADGNDVSNNASNVVDWYSQQPTPPPTQAADPIRAVIASRVQQQRQAAKAAVPSQSQASANPGSASNTTTNDSDPSYLGLAKRQAYDAIQGLGGAYHDAATSLATINGAVPVMLDKLHSVLSGQPQTGLQDAWFRNMVDPLVAQDSAFQLGPNATFADRFTHGAAQMVGKISQAILTAPEEAAVKYLGDAKPLATAMAGVKAMTAPGAADAVQAGRQVLQKSGDKGQAVNAGVMHYLSSALVGALPEIKR